MKVTKLRLDPERVSRIWTLASALMAVRRIDDMRGPLAAAASAYLRLERNLRDGDLIPINTEPQGIAHLGLDDEGFYVLIPDADEVQD